MMQDISDFSPGVLHINLTDIQDNFKYIQSLSVSRAGAVVKADAYGLGADSVSAALYAAGCRDFFVASVEEGTKLRLKDARVYVLGGLYPGAADVYAAHRLIPALCSPGMAEEWRMAAKRMNRALPSCLFFDTGMNRLGLSADEAVALSADGLDVRMVMSHFACGDERDHSMNEQQAQQFIALSARYPAAEKSLCHSSGIFGNTTWHHDLLRPGYALYGGNPTPEKPNSMKAVVSLFVPVLQTRQVKKGESIGYNATHVFGSNTETATLAMGYADGFLRSASNRARFFWNGQPCPVRGRVSMDFICVETGHLTGPKPKPGDMMEVLGPHQTIDDLAGGMNTSGYEVLTALKGRYRRIYTPESLFTPAKTG